MVPRKRVKRECGEASRKHGQFRSCPRNCERVVSSIKPLEASGFREGRAKRRSASQETCRRYESARQTRGGVHLWMI